MQPLFSPRNQCAVDHASFALHLSSTVVHVHVFNRYGKRGSLIQMRVATCRQRKGQKRWGEKKVFAPAVCGIQARAEKVRVRRGCRLQCECLVKSAYAPTVLYASTCVLTGMVCEAI
jgi:hypothetical protein